MKNSTFLVTLAISATLMIVSSGCKKMQVSNTPIPGSYIKEGTPDRTITTTTPGQNTGGPRITRPSNPGGDSVSPIPAPVEPKTGIVDVPQVPPTNNLPFDQTNIWTTKWDLPLTPDATIFSAYTVYFELDKSTIREGEQSKLEHIAEFFKSNTNDLLMIEGHCDERGTEQYNLALGDRRALAVREYLCNLGVDPGRVHTVSFGEARPVDPGHTEAAWSKNRRGVSILMKVGAAIQ